ncbi:MULTISPECIES: hypothetical protein [Hydrocarboniphaga]|jgi:hypothetical protein|uniref:Uncharacterized protein n=2 Tax=Hydrocarboniphaga effusa TaxID=243629 RepID=I7ZI48_9GAMM|nr:MULTISPECIES: hypothetical protein [Hydrocarboniphaga]EIT71579.1 hypothetical protein WQQ_17160 [Hydrocarboniphaga effusa AP103]MDZ4077543.1 hypothetical protein [Hydrocarboniphaga sp.]
MEEPPLPELSYAEIAELVRIRKSRVENKRTRHNREALQSLIHKGMVAPGLHAELTPEGERLLERKRPEALRPD